MIRVIIREIGVLALSVSIFPLAFVFLVFRGDISEYGASLIYRELVNTGSSSLMSAMFLISRLLAPYLVIQGIRAYKWSKTGIEAKRWANLYFAFLSGVAGTWFAIKSLDLFYFMFELGDIPGELGQFLQLEYTNLLGAVAGFYFFFRCLRFFIIRAKSFTHED
ncbi:MAG: hypothetical protein M1511_08800 [Deltaproteobacteria bacterium]|nr:hypothetical protein [Deltaproteobacteria bacterium]